jgi:hypothetical protein
MLTIRFIKAMCLTDMRINHAGIFIIQQPLINALQRKFARTMTW